MLTKNLIDLNTYIKCDFIKKSFKESYNIVDSIDLAEEYAKKIRNGEKLNLLFETSYIKEHFFSTLREYDVNIKIINCNCNYDRFLEDFNENDKSLCIYNNVNNCKDLDILNIIKENKGLLIC